MVVAATHLDHISEAQRARQMKHLLSVLEEYRAKGKRVLIAGDLNALDRDDYSDEEWSVHARLWPCLP